MKKRRDKEELIQEGEVDVDEALVGRSAALMSVLVIVSRLTGFFRTWGQAFALGVTVTASCYTVANNLPNQLYELVMGGLISTAFLPVYLSLKRKAGQKGANTYASNLLSIVLILMGIICVFGFIFAFQVILTQSAGASKDFDYDLAIYFFRFFVIEVMLYALSSILSGLLNAERDYVWSNAAPIFNNIICTLSFVFAWLLFPVNEGAALLVLAIGNPAGVLVQVLLQIPSLKKHGIRLRPYINFHDPALKETLSIGVPSVVAMICAFVTVSVQSSYALQVTAKGAAIIYYARLWYTLPYAILAIPITIAMFTELSEAYSNQDMHKFKKGIVSGTSRIFFFLIPFALFVLIFSPALISLFNGGSFTSEDVGMTAAYLGTLALSLPIHGVCTYLQKVCSSYRKMILYAVSNVIASIAQIIFCVFLVPLYGINMVGLSSLVFYLVIDGLSFAKLNTDLGGLGVKQLLFSAVRSLALGVAGALAGLGLLMVLESVFGLFPTSFSHGLLLCILAGIPAVLVTYGLAFLFHVPEYHYLSGIVRLKR